MGSSRKYNKQQKNNFKNRKSYKSEIPELSFTSIVYLVNDRVDLSIFFSRCFWYTSFRFDYKKINLLYFVHNLEKLLKKNEKEGQKKIFKKIAEEEKKTMGVEKNCKRGRRRK